MREDPSNRNRIGDERDEPDVAAAGWALERKLLPHPGQEFRPGNPRGVMRAGLLIRFAAARGMRLARMITGTGLAPLADVPFSPAPGRVDLRPRPGPTQVAALCLGST